MALQEGIDSAIFIGKLIEFLTGIKVPIYCHIDSRQLYESIYSSKAVLEKRLRVEISSIQEMLKNNEIEGIKWISTKEMTADCVTKKSCPDNNLINLINAASSKFREMTKEIDFCVTEMYGLGTVQIVEYSKRRKQFTRSKYVVT